MTSPRVRNGRPALEALEERLNLSLYTFSFAGGVLTVWSNASASDVRITGSGGSATVQDSTNSFTVTRTGVSRVQVVGGAAADKVVSAHVTMPLTVWGQGGNDDIRGSGGADRLYGGDGNDEIRGWGGNDTVTGGAGNDVLRGGSGNDMMWGDAGNDVLRGDDGNDQLRGGDNNDRLNGGNGVDFHYGGTGDDVIVTIDNAVGEFAYGEDGRDVIWTDRIGTINDFVVGATTADVVRNVAAFSNAGADRTLNGDSISLPAVDPGLTFKRFADNPLFSSAGPKVTDLDQGAVGNCWLLAGLGAIAIDGGGPASYAKTHVLRQRIVDFDDGTYGVHLGAKFYRVDDRLPVSSATALWPAYAKLGAEESMWVVVAEKAYAHYHENANSYVNLNGGWSKVVNQAFGAPLVGHKNLSAYTSNADLINDLRTKWLTYQAVTVGVTGIGAGVPLVDDHAYTVHSFQWSGGVIVGVILRNPWGTDGAGNDGNNDGLVTVTAAQLRTCVGRVDWGRVAF